MARTQEQTAASDVAEALLALGLGVTVEWRGGSVEIGLPDGRRIALDVVALAAPRLADIDRLIDSRRLTDAVPMLVADRLVPPVRERLSAAGWGWLDRRGRLRLAAGMLLIDTEVPSVIREAVVVRPVLDTSVGLAVSTALLAHPRKRMSVRDVVAFTGHSLGAVHQALHSLQEERLRDAEGLPVTPDLFWETSVRWRPQRFALLLGPTPGDARRTGQLDLGLDDIETSTGWALCDTLAANAFGAFGVVGGDHPPDYYVPDERTVRVCRRLYGEAISTAGRGATVAVPPVRWACVHRLDPVALGRSNPWDEWPVVHPVIAALDLSIDAGRGREILEDWKPPDPYRRVW